MVWAWIGRCHWFAHRGRHVNKRQLAVIKFDRGVKDLMEGRKGVVLGCGNGL